MARTDERGGPQTRARIAEVAAGLFVERGYDAVTVAEVARAAGVSSVTVFNHFPRKEDLFLDRADDAVELLRTAVRDRATGVGVTESLHGVARRLAREGHPLSGLNDHSLPFLRTVAGSTGLLARSREIAAELERSLADDLERDATFEGDAALCAAFFIAGYRVVLVHTARLRLAGEAPDEILNDHLSRLDALVDSLRGGFGPSS